MVAQQDPTRRYTVEEWRRLLESSDVKYDYHSGWVVAMAGGSFDHSRIAINVVRTLEDGLGDGPCRVYNSEMAVRLSPTEYRFPDATVTCDERDRGRGREIQSPRVLVEVLSDSTEQDDRTEKLALYRACPSVEEYVLIGTRYQTVEVYRRAEPRWSYQDYSAGSTIDLESIGVSLSVDQLYHLTDVPLHSEPGRRAGGQETFG